MIEIINISGPSPLTIVNKAVQCGSSLPWLQNFSGKYSPTTGWSFNQKFSGLSYWQMQRLAYLYSNSGCSYTISYEFGKATLETEDNRGNVTIDVWEIGVNRTTRGSLQNPRYLDSSFTDTYLGGADSDAMMALAVFAASSKTADDYSTCFAVLEASSNPNAATVGERLLQRLNIGQDTYQFDQYTLKHTTNASNRGYYNVADDNVNCIYTYSQLLSEITDAAFWIFPCPPEILGAIADIFDGLDPVQDAFLQGALKGGSQRTTTANNRINLSTEYALDNWSTDEYGSV